jgi:hypothetical protein
VLYLANISSIIGYNIPHYSIFAVYVLDKDSHNAATDGHEMAGVGHAVISLAGMNICPTILPVR